MVTCVRTRLSLDRILSHSFNSYPHIIGFNGSQRYSLDHGELLKWINVDFPFHRTGNAASMCERCVRPPTGIPTSRAFPLP